MQARLRLDAAIGVAFAAGRGVPCVEDPCAFDVDGGAELWDVAAAACGRCPALAERRAWLDCDPSVSGVVAGVVLTECAVVGVSA